ncbi:hypothetical protein [Actinosynnema sp. NPDC020468]|uniref:hypothetical protein n=1 Tax=Actinosynnema sp. NPDC020468 TaxID=3154488 RepID=UPI0033E78766
MIRALAAVTAIAATLVVTPQAQASVRITRLPALSGDYRASARVVNDDGAILGTNSPVNTGQQHAVLWKGTTPVDLGTGSGVDLNRNGKALISEYVGSAGRYLNRVRVWSQGSVTELTPPGGTFVTASALNGGGTVPLAYATDPTNYQPDKAGVWRDGGFAPSGAVAQGPDVVHSVVNDGGVTAGYRVPKTGDSYAFRCDATCVRLPGVAGPGTYTAVAINESGVVVGTLQNGLQSQALRWDGNTLTVLPGGPAALPYNRQAVNERGDVVGYRLLPDGTRKAALWRDGRLVDLGTSGESVAEAVNDLGEVVGWQTKADGNQVAYLWRNGTLVDLGSVDGRSSAPTALNNTGTVIGWSTTPEEYFQAVKWTVRG